MQLYEILVIDIQEEVKGRVPLIIQRPISFSVNVLSLRASLNTLFLSFGYPDRIWVALKSGEAKGKKRGFSEWKTRRP